MRNCKNFTLPHLKNDEYSIISGPREKNHLSGPLVILKFLFYFHFRGTFGILQQTIFSCLQYFLPHALRLQMHEKENV